MPIRVQLSRRKGWRMPADTVKVDRATKWGNPFVVGEDGTRFECVRLYRALAEGYLCISKAAAHVGRQRAALAVMATAPAELRGKHLACWCPLDAHCHADILLAIANQKENC